MEQQGYLEQGEQATRTLGAARTGGRTGTLRATKNGHNGNTATGKNTGRHRDCKKERKSRSRIGTARRGAGSNIGDRDVSGQDLKQHDGQKHHQIYHGQ